MFFIRQLLSIILIGTLARGATYYVASTGSTPAGNNSNSGLSLSSPWSTFDYAVNHITTGDTIVLKADGNKITCDTTLPATITNITVVSSALNSLPADGYRVIPAADSANLGKCQFSGLGMLANGETHGLISNIPYQQFSISSSTFTLTAASNFTDNGLTFANGTEVFFIFYDNLTGGNYPPDTVAVPSPLTLQTKYYVVNCSSSPACGLQNSTFQVSATSGGSPITITACDSDCLAYGLVSLPTQVDTSGDTITSTDTLGAVYVNGTPVTFSTGGIQYGGTLPAPLVSDTIYYIRDLSSNHFKVAATLGGAALDLTTVGTGMLSVSNANIANGWTFNGIEFAPTTGNFMTFVISLGTGRETSILSMPSNFTFKHIFCHDFSEVENGPRRCIAENSINFNLQDSQISGMKEVGNGDTQCVGGWSSYGPTTVKNNLFVCAGENSEYGGVIPAYYPLANQDKTFTNNFYSKPYIWKWTSGTSIPSGTCLFDPSDSPDPDHRGGEFYLRTTNSQGYICVNGTWTTTGTTPNHYSVKNLFEYKNGRRFTVTGNIFSGEWVDAQDGHAMLFGQNVDSGAGTANDHLTFTHNKITNSYQFVAWGSKCSGVSTGIMPCVNGLTSNHTIKNNLVILGGAGYCGVSFQTSTCGYPQVGLTWATSSATLDTFDHNTIISPDGLGAPYSPFSWRYDTPITPPLNDQMTFTNSIQSYDFYGTGQSQFLNYFSNSTWSRMAMIGASGPFTGSIGATNVMNNTDLPANTAAVDFVNASGGDYHLDPVISPYSAAAGCSTFCSSDGSDLGADIDKINAEISGVVAGVPKWATRMNFILTPTLTGAVVTYDRPGNSACSLTLYNSAARISGNENADTNSSGNKLDTRTGNTLVGSHVTFNLGTVSPLTRNTTYWYKLSCVAVDTSTWLLAGDSFTTLANGSISGVRIISGKRIIQ